jgi:hypothetical protein
MRPRVNRIVLVAMLGLAAVRTARAQDAPPRIGPFVVDVHGVVPRFGDDPDLAASRGLSQPELPGMGLGISAGAHVYLPRTGPVTVGLGADVVIGRSPMPVFSGPPDPATKLRPVTETFKSFGPQLSLNFGNGNGWSYLSGGIGLTTWSIVPDGATPLAIDEERKRTLNYGGGARWFAKKHFAFSLDVRLYNIPAGTPQPDVTATPRTLLMVIGAGLSVR